MDLWSLMRVVTRRWYVAVPMVLLTVVVAFATTASIPPEYEVDGALLLVGPSTVEVDDGVGETQLEEQNPLLGFPSSLGTVARTMDLLLGSQETRAEFAAKGLEPGYVIGSDDRSPILQFLVTSIDRDVATATMDELMSRVRSELQRSQDELDAPASQRIAVQEISPDNEPSPGYANKRRSQILLLAAGLLATMFATVAVDAVLRRRARGRGDGDGREVGWVDDLPPGPGSMAPVDGPAPVLVGAATSAFAGAPHVAAPLTNGHALASTIAPTDRNGAQPGTAFDVAAAAAPVTMPVHAPFDAAPAPPPAVPAQPANPLGAPTSAALSGVVIRRAVPGTGHPRPPLVARSTGQRAPEHVPSMPSPVYSGAGVGADAMAYARPAQAVAHPQGADAFAPPSRGLVDAMRSRQPDPSAPTTFGGPGFGSFPT